MAHAKEPVAKMGDRHLETRSQSPLCYGTCLNNRVLQILEQRVIVRSSADGDANEMLIETDEIGGIPNSDPAFQKTMRELRCRRPPQAHQQKIRLAWHGLQVG